VLFGERLQDHRRQHERGAFLENGREVRIVVAGLLELDRVQAWSETTHALGGDPTGRATVDVDSRAGGLGRYREAGARAQDARDVSFGRYGFDDRDGGLRHRCARGEVQAGRR